MKRFILTSLMLPCLFLVGCSEVNQKDEVNQSQKEGDTIQEHQKNKMLRRTMKKVKKIHLVGTLKQLLKRKI
ncbi:hypothetical protein JF544_02260 [Halobacillus kuroshimensis]|uniref:Lipoprotein n=1 Tax=Halobacillus kuroshimensis TaxID=302481 RepID=A0ABS3DRU8_9BACI|nr:MULTISPECIES: hypothetical protein [Halobacillus]MBN8234046.1 hypothetical protein [Halobacillus kuroshimensis]